MYFLIIRFVAPENEMLRRMNAIKDLFQNQCDYHDVGYWLDWVLPIAQKIAAGEQPVIFPVSAYAAANVGQATEEATLIELFRDMGVEIAPDNQSVIAAGEQKLQQMIDQRINRLLHDAKSHVQYQLGLSPSMATRISTPNNPATAETRTFFDALQAYRTHLDETGKRRDDGSLAPSPRNYKRWSLRLEEHHENFSVWSLDYDRIQKLIAYWRNCPVSKKDGKKISKSYAKHILDCLWDVVLWLDASSSWKWDLPKGADRLKRTPYSTETDREKTQTRRVSGMTYDVDQLAIIVNGLSKFEKMIVGISVNCAMQPAEVGRLEVDDFYDLHPETKKVSDWIVFNRPKTHHYGEWLLWPEVAHLVRWGIRRSQRIGVERLVVDENGTPWYQEQWQNPSMRFSKWWQAKPSKTSSREGVVTKLSRERDGFPRNTIKTLRKVLPNILRPMYGQEIADLVNARTVSYNGTLGGRDTDRYADRLYDTLARALKELEQRFRPFLDALAESGDEQNSTQFNTKLDTKLDTRHDSDAA